MKTYSHLFSSYSVLEDFFEKNKISDSKHLLIQCFDGTLNIEKTHQLLIYLKSILPNCRIIGSSTDGEIIDGNTNNNTLVLSFSFFESTKIESYVRSLDHVSFDIGVEIGTLSNRHGAKAAIIFSDPLHGNGDELMEGISSVNSSTLFAGGMSGDNALFEKTYVILDEVIYFNSVAAVFLCGDNLRVNNSYSFNWIPIGPEFTVTHSEDNRVYTLDNTPVVQIYREYFGDKIADYLPAVGVAFPIIMRSNGDLIGRAAMGIHQDDSLSFGGTIPQGSVVQIGIGNASIMIEKSEETQREIISHQPEAIFIYSCMARRRFLGDSIQNETQPLQQISPVSGFFTYGEFYTNKAQKKCSLMNQTMSILTLSEHPIVSTLPKQQLNKEKINDWTILTFTALSHFITKTSIELQILNSTLQRRVNEEIIQNREKDKIMFSQAKHATMGEMISMIAHQWRQPLTAVGLISNNLALDAALDEIEAAKVTSSTTMINEQIQYLSRTIDDFSNYFSPENEQGNFTIQNFYNEIITIIGKSLEHFDISITFDFDPDFTITTYRRDLIQICLNLVNNAKDVIVENKIKDGKIKFIHRFLKNQHQIRISDNGGGVPDEIKERIFDPYFSTKGNKNGTGLGLYMSKTIAQNHLNGDLILINYPEGATFMITIIETREVSYE